MYSKSHGILAKAALTEAAIPVKVDLPGVGQHLEDHPIVGVKYRLGRVGGSWLPVSLTKLWLAFPSLLTSYILHGKGPLSSSGVDIGYFGASNASYTDKPGAITFIVSSLTTSSLI